MCAHFVTAAAKRAKNKANVIKAPAQPKRTIQNADDDHEVGLWIDKDVLRRIASPGKPVLVSNRSTEEQNRYLQLADLVLGEIEPFKKTGTE